MADVVAISRNLYIMTLKLRKWFNLLALKAIFIVIAMLAPACGGDDSRDAAQNDQFLQVNDIGAFLTPNHLDAIGFKKRRAYDLDGLPGATAAIFGFWRIASDDPIDYEIRFYPSHADAVELGAELAEEGTGVDAVLDASKANYKEGVKDRRMITGKGPGGGGRSSTGPRYGDYAIYGNVVMLCAGAELDQALSRCEELAMALNDAAVE